MSDVDNEQSEIGWRDKLEALYRVAQFRPLYAGGVLVLSVFAALLEGFGLSFILPIVELAQSDGVDPAQADGLLGAFLTVYDFLGIPFTMGYLVVGVSLVMVVRFTSSFLVGWLRAALRTKYVRHLQTESFESALNAKVSYFDREGSDDILNAIVTQAENAGNVIRFTINLVEQSLLAMIYLGVAFYLAPRLTVVTGIFLGGVTYLFRSKVETGYSIGDRVAQAKEDIQEYAQAGTQGIRDVKLFNMMDEVFEGFTTAVREFEDSNIHLRRNQVAIQNFYQLTTAVTVFVLIYAALTFSSLSLGSLSIFLFAMFRLGPRVSNINKLFYRTEGELPHLVRTQEFLEDLDRSREPNKPKETMPDEVDEISFENVWFSYDSSDETVLRDLSFSVDRGDFAAFVGPSGAGKSTIMSLLSRMYEPDEGEIKANGTPIDDFDVSEWRSRVSVVRQDPHIFNDTLRKNVTIGNRDATDDDVERVSEIAQVTEFLDELPNGYDTVLGDQGVKLSGGQRQRVAIARALLKDADLLILDEATSDLDMDLERKVHRAIESMDRDYAILVIAHRLSTVVNADCIYTLESGEIIESGDHDELMDNGDVYSDLYSMQVESMA
ncbi:ABC transporter ATP-binding protein [Halorutilales archaeon Cl-col2-1]